MPALRCGKASGVAALFAGLLAGCASQMGTVAGLLGPDAYPAAMVLATGVEGEDCGTSILFVPLREPSLAQALTRALSKVPEATLLVDGRVETRGGVYGQRCVLVRGSAAKFVRGLVVPAPEGHHGADGGHH